MNFNASRQAPRSGALCHSRVVCAGLAAIACSPALAGNACQLADLAGRYIGLDNGYARINGRSTPSSRLYLEDWSADGRVSGTVWQRLGQRFKAMTYTGQANVGADCTGLVSRRPSSGLWRSSVVVSPTTRRTYSIDLTRGSTITGSLSPQTVTACAPDTLKGVVLSTQAGFSVVKGRWQPNAVIQREAHDGAGNLVGLAISNYAGQPETASYTGQFKLNPDCTGTLRETDSLGTPYNYRVVVDGAGRGYYYLQTDPKDLTGAYLGVEP
ncbi:hypothetical protein [Methylomagnum sp.]